MRTTKLWRIAFVMLAAFSIASCSSVDDNEDKVEQVTVYVSAETGVYYDMWLDSERKNPIVGMQMKEKGDTRWRCVSLYTITGFTYEKGNKYELLVKKTTLANPPQDDINVRYELIRIVSKRAPAVCAMQKDIKNKKTNSLAQHGQRQNENKKHLPSAGKGEMKK